MSPILLIVILIFCKHDQHFVSLNTVQHQFLKKAEWCWLYWPARYSSTAGVILTCSLILRVHLLWFKWLGWMPNNLRQRDKIYVINYFILFLLPHQTNKAKSLVCEKKDLIFCWYNSRLLQQTQVGFLSVMTLTFAILTFLFLIKS